MSKLLSQGGFGCVYYPGIKCDGKVNDDDSVVTKLQKKNFNANNEIALGKLVTKIPNYPIYFLPVKNSCPINIREIDSKLAKECDIVTKQKNSDSAFILMTIPFIKNKDFFDVLTDKSLEKKQIVLTIIETYSYLLYSLDQLQHANIVHFDLKADNILYNTLTNDPQIIDFGISIPIRLLTPKTWKQYFYIYAPEYYIWPLEVHVICFLLYNTDEPLTEDNIKEICKDFVFYNKALDVFSSTFRHKYLQLCEKSLETYISKPKDSVITELISYSYSWDNYSLSVLYLKIFNYMFPTGIHKNTILTEFSQILASNISPDVSARYNTIDTRSKFEDIFFTTGNVKEYQDIVTFFNNSSSKLTKQIKDDKDSLQRLRSMSSNR